MKIQEFIEQEQIKPSDLIWLVEEKELNKYTKKPKPTYKDFEAMFLFVSEKQDILQSPIYTAIKKLNILQIQKGKREGGDDYTLVIKNAGVSKKHIQANLPVLRPLI